MALEQLVYLADLECIYGNLWLPSIMRFDRWPHILHTRRYTEKRPLHVWQRPPDSSPDQFNSVRRQSWRNRDEIAPAWIDTRSASVKVNHRTLDAFYQRLNIDLVLRVYKPMAEPFGHHHDVLEDQALYDVGIDGRSFVHANFMTEKGQCSIIGCDRDNRSESLAGHIDVVPKYARRMTFRTD